MNLGNINKIFRLVTFLFLIFSFTGISTFVLKTELKEDGSGTMKVSYWAKTSDIKDGLSTGFPFLEEKIISTYASENNTVSNISISPTKSDTTYINFTVNFIDITKINSAKGFSDLNTNWKKGLDGTMNFVCFLSPNTEINTEQMPGDVKFYYIFNFNGDIINTNGYKEGDLITFTRSLSATEKDFTMTALINPTAYIKNKNQESGIKLKLRSCGIIGIELPLILAAVLILPRFKLIKRKRTNL